MNNPESTIRFCRISLEPVAWLQNDKLHRLGGPAVEYANGDKVWYQNGKRHRLDGPAAEYANGGKSWYIEGVKLTQAEHVKRTSAKVHSCTNKTVIIDGVEYVPLPKE